MLDTKHNNKPKITFQNQYLKKLHESTLQDVIDDLVKEKEEGWKNRTL